MRFGDLAHERCAKKKKKAGRSGVPFLRITRAYRTVSAEAATIIACSSTGDLTTQKRARDQDGCSGTADSGCSHREQGAGNRCEYTAESFGPPVSVPSGPDVWCLSVCTVGFKSFRFIFFF